MNPKKTDISHYQLVTAFFTEATAVQIYSCLKALLGEGNGTPLQYSCLENPMDGGAW